MRVLSTAVVVLHVLSAIVVCHLFDFRIVLLESQGLSRMMMTFAGRMVVSKMCLGGRS